MPTIKIKSGLEANRLSITPLLGELLFTTDTQKVYGGDGSTPGGTSVELTPIQVLNLLKTVDGTGSGLDLDLLTSNSGEQYVRSDQDGTLDGTLTLNSAVFADIIKQVYANTITKIFIYDTSKDSDGGQWRKNTGHLSWYNETLNTATRGSTKEFPAKALIALESNKLTIFDLTNVKTPMWMVFNVSSPGTNNGPHIYASGVRTISSVSMINGDLVVGSNRSDGGTGIGCFRINFLKDDALLYFTNTVLKHFHNIKNRNLANTSEGYVVSTTLDHIINLTINDVDMVVLDNAPIDPETNLPIPTIAIATDGGVSVINNDNIVADFTYTVSINNISNNVHISKKGLFYSSRDSDIYMLHYNNFDFSNSNAPDYIYSSFVESVGQDLSTSVSSNILDIDRYDDKLYIAGNNHLTIVDEVLTDSSKGMVNFIANDYQSGWMHGDIKGAFLANSKTLDRSVNNNSLVENGTITESVANTGSELNAYSGFTTSNYLQQAYNSDLDFGTGDFYIMGWVKNIGTSDYILDRAEVDGNNRFALLTDSSGQLWFFTSKTGEGSSGFISSKFGDISSIDKWMFICARRSSTGVMDIIVDGVKDSISLSARTIGGSSAVLTIGVSYLISVPQTGELSLLRVGAGLPTDEQISKIYNSERLLFNENADCTLSSSGSTVNNISYDDSSELLHVAGTTNVDTFDGLIRTSSQVEVFTNIHAVNGTAIKGI